MQFRADHADHPHSRAVSGVDHRGPERGPGRLWSAWSAVQRNVLPTREGPLGDIVFPMVIAAVAARLGGNE
jgi:hypothetical protein